MTLGSSSVLRQEALTMFKPYLKKDINCQLLAAKLQNVNFELAIAIIQSIFVNTLEKVRIVL